MLTLLIVEVGILAGPLINFIPVGNGMTVRTVVSDFIEMEINAVKDIANYHGW